MSDITEFQRRMSTPAHPDGDPTLMVVEILRITKERDSLLEDKARLDKIQKLALENPIHKDDGFTYYRGWGYNPCEEHGVTPFSLRAAIDAAKGVGQ
jgi:hypothetical protein